MIILNDRKFVSASFDNEEEIERVVLEQSELLFGPDSMLLPKSLIRSADGAGTVPDAFAIDFGKKRWFLVEAELSSHSVWGHVAPQVSKQIVASQQPLAKQQIVDLAVKQIQQNPGLQEHIGELGINTIDIRKVLADIIESRPIVGIPIDNVSQDLREWAQTLKNEVKLWLVRKLVDFNNATSVMYDIPDEYTPVFDSTVESQGSNGNAYYDVTVADLIRAKLLEPKEQLTMQYGMRGGPKQTYVADVTENGNLVVGGHSYSSPSYAALYCIQQAGSDRKTVNGWTSWRTSDGKLLADLRTDFISSAGEAASAANP